MVLFSLELEDKKEAIDFLTLSDSRLHLEDAVRNPFVGGIRILNTEQGKINALVLMNPIYPNISYLGWVMAGGLYLIFGGSLWLSIPAAFGLTGIMWTKWPYYYGISKGLKKAGYKGTIKLIRLDDLLRKIYY